MGYDQPKTLYQANGIYGQPSTRINLMWARLMNAVYDTNPKLATANGKIFKQPSGVVSRTFCGITGHAYTSACAGNARTDLFNANVMLPGPETAFAGGGLTDAFMQSMLSPFGGDYSKLFGAKAKEEEKKKKEKEKKQKETVTENKPTNSSRKPITNNNSNNSNGSKNNSNNSNGSNNSNSNAGNSNSGKPNNNNSNNNSNGSGNSNNSGDSGNSDGSTSGGSGNSSSDNPNNNENHNNNTDSNGG